MIFPEFSPTVNVMASAVIVLGLVTVVLALWVTRYFARAMPDKNQHSRHLSRALQFQLIGESIISAGTLLFAIATYIGVLEHWSIYFVSAIRVVMFVASGLTTMYLYRVVKSLSDG